MGWFLDEELELIHAYHKEDTFPSALEFLDLSKQLRERKARDRAAELLTAFKAVAPHECPDIWYGQLEHLHSVAKILRDTEAQQHAQVVNDAVRDASRQSVRVVRSEEQRKRVRHEMKGMDDHGFPGRAEVVSSAQGVHAPACDITEVFTQGGPLVCQRVKDAGYTLESKPIGRQGAVPTPAKLAAIKDRCLDELTSTAAFVSWVGKNLGIDVVGQFKANIHRQFNLELFCAVGCKGISASDLFTLLPMILDRRQQSTSDRLLRELQARFMAFRIDFGTLCSPLEQYIPIYEAIFRLFSYVNEGLMQEHGGQVLGMFRAMFSAVLDLLAGSVEALGWAIGTGLGVAVGAAGALMAEVAGAASVASLLGPVTAALSGAVACGLVVRGLVGLVDVWVRRGNHARVSAIFRRTETGAWRVWIIELLQ